MKILFLIRSLNFGGAERHLTSLSIGLRERGHDVKVAVFYGGGPLEADLNVANIPVLNLSKKGRWDVLGFFGSPHLHAAI